ncbi:MAG: hypothetical protein MJZ78_01585 [Bacteroidales bacterium]|nr:hypothetical protein [Bacteroidales bacterium]
MDKFVKANTMALICITMTFFVSCNKANTESGGGSVQTVATVTTNDITEVTATTAVCGGEVKMENGWRVVERGVCWNTEPNPTPSDFHTSDGEGLGKFTSNITGLIENTKYYVRAYAINDAGTGFGSEISFTTKIGSWSGEHEYVDLGLPSGLLWATCNVGANTPEDLGDYFAWGETTTKNYYGWFLSYKWYNDSCNSITKYCSDSHFGVVDNKTILDPDDDVAHVKWGENWRMPTCDEINELKTNCTFVWTTQNGVPGILVTGQNDNSIFLPAAGYHIDESHYDAFMCGTYWSSSLESEYPEVAFCLSFSVGFNGIYDFGRHGGLSVRPVSTCK